MPAEPGAPAADDLLGMPATAYLVLGVLAAFDEPLTAGEIKTRAEHTVGRFYWSPSVSHIRRELSRLLESGLVATEVIEVGARSMSVYQVTGDGQTILGKWAGMIPEADPVLKHPLMLKLWLSRDSDPQALLPAIDRYIERIEYSIDKAHWAARRSREVGRLREDEDEDDGTLRYTRLVLGYSLRSLYAELANVRQLRDEIAWRYSGEPPRVMNLPTTQVRRLRRAGDESV